MKLVVTGALGHIGSFLIRDLVVQFPDSEIIMLDNMMTQRYPSLYNLPDSGRYRFIQGDVTKIDLRPIFSGAYAVLHLAAITDAAGSFDKASLVERNNYQATKKVAKSCAETGARLIALSSTSVYGTQKDEVGEECPIEDLKPQSPYAETKLKEEQLLARLASENGLSFISCRFGTIFGASPGMRFHTAVNKFCWQAVMAEPITVWSTAYEQKRPYLALSDASRAIGFILNEDLFNGRIYNVLTQNATVRQVVDVIREFVPSLNVSFVDSPIMNQFSYEVSSLRFQKEGFVFTGNLRSAISDTITILRQSNMSLNLGDELKKEE